MLNKSEQLSEETNGSLDSLDLDVVEARVAEKLGGSLTGKKLEAARKVSTAIVMGSLFLTSCQAIDSTGEVPITTNETSISEESGYAHQEYTKWVGLKEFRVSSDSTGSTEFKDFIGHGEDLADAWTVKGSIYSQWYGLQNLKSISDAPDSLEPRWGEPEVISINRLDIEMIKEELGFENTVIILDSGGPHSVGMALELATQGGWQPVPMTRETPCLECLNRTGGETLGVYLYGASEMDELITTLSPDAPPAFIWNSHRQGIQMEDSKADNSYAYSVRDMPSPDFLKEQGITSIVYVSESGNISNEDAVEILNNYEREGIIISHFIVSPVTNDPQMRLDEMIWENLGSD